MRAGLLMPVRATFLAEAVEALTPVRLCVTALASCFRTFFGDFLSALGPGFLRLGRVTRERPFVAERTRAGRFTTCLFARVEAGFSFMPRVGHGPLGGRLAPAKTRDLGASAQT